MDELENLAKRAEGFEKKAEEASTWESPEEAKQAGKIAAPDRLEAAANRAEGFLKIAESGFQLFLDRRLKMDEEEIADGRSSLAPVIEKYNLMGEGDGNLPYQAEISAGFYLGGLWKRLRRAMVEIKAFDQAKAKAAQQAREQANNGQKREYQPQEQAQPIPSQVGVRQEPDIKQEGWLG